MRVLVDGLEAGLIEVEVVDGEFLENSEMSFDLDRRFTVQTDDGSRIIVDGMLVQVDIVSFDPKRVM